MAHLLLIDDDKSIGEVMPLVLDELGHTVTVVASLNQLSSVKNNKYDLILLDLNIGSLSGKAVIDEIRKYSFTHSTPLILFSADYAVDAFEKNKFVKGVLKKPFNITELATVINNHISI
jgi:DNA-binding response OmpR family regulator